MFVKLYNDNPNQKDIDKITSILRDGGLVIYPTDTVYAMGCNALNVRAVEKICKIKGINPEKNNLAIICRSLSEISEYAKMDDGIFRLLKNNLPGPFTFILNTTSSLPKIYKNKKTVGVRIPDNNIIQALVESLGNPILTTSIKDDQVEEIEYITDPELIYEKYQNIVDAVIDGGYGGSEGSTVVDCTGDEPLIIREGKGELLL